MKQKTLWGLFVGLAFASILCGVQIDSTHADENHLNGLYLGLTILFGAASLAFGIKAFREQ